MNKIKKAFLYLPLLGVTIFSILNNTTHAQERMRYDAYTGCWYSEYECPPRGYYFSRYGYCSECENIYYEFNQYNLNDYPFYYNDPSPFNFWGDY